MPTRSPSRPEVYCIAASSEQAPSYNQQLTVRQIFTMKATLPLRVAMLPGWGTGGGRLLNLIREYEYPVTPDSHRTH